MADDLDERKLRENIAEILKNGDLATLTSKKIRQILESKYEVSLKDRKKQIDDIVMSLVDEQSDDNAEENPSPERESRDVEKSPVKKQKVSVASERVSVISSVPTQKKKAQEEKSSESEEEESDDDDKDDDDEDYNASSNAKNRRKNKRPAPKASSKKSSKKEKRGKEGGTEGGKKRTGFSMPMVLSPELANLMGETHMARSEVVKKMWQIIKERNLMDPANKRYTICDEQLEKIIGQKRFLTFSMMKYLKKHVKDPALMAD